MMNKTSTIMEDEAVRQKVREGYGKIAVCAVASRISE